MTATKSLLVVTAALEVATGVAMLAVPAVVVSLLLGATLDTPGGYVIARVAGAAVLSLGLVCWFARHDGLTRSGRGVIAAMLAYNIMVVAVLIHAGLGMGLAGFGLWPAAGVHTALAIWCVASLG